MNSNILVIEDDQILGDILIKRLETAGYSASLVTDGEDGLRTIQTNKPDLVLLDILLPSMNGYEILSAKRDNPEIKDIPVIIISNSGQPVELQRALELGARDYFIKAQLDPDDIVSKVQKVIPSNKLNESLSLVGKKILLVEDDQFLSDVLGKKLHNEHCIVFTATSGEKAIETAEKEIPHVVLLDLVLPGITGFETLEKIKANPLMKNVRVIILSNLSQQEDIERAKTLGADLFLIKATSTPSEVFSSVKSVLLAS